MKRIWVAGFILLAMNTACEEKKKTVRPAVDTSKDIVLANPVEISLPTVPSEPVDKPLVVEKDKAMALSAKTMPEPKKVVPSPVVYEDVASQVLAEGGANEEKEEGLARIKEKAQLRAKALEEEAAKVVAAVEETKVAMVEPSAASSNETAEPSIELPASDSAPVSMPSTETAATEIVIKSDKVDAKTAKTLEIRYNKARSIAKDGKLEEAKNLFLTNCQAGHAHSCHKFAWYEESVGNIDNATRFYRAACDNGLGKSCNNLAFQFEQKKNFDKALDLYARGCMDKHEASCVSLKRIREEQLLEKDGLKAR